MSKGLRTLHVYPSDLVSHSHKLKCPTKKVLVPDILCVARQMFEMGSTARGYQFSGVCGITTVSQVTTVWLHL